ncbi:DUF4350 domain-containing protein [Compostibacter hankyongensis]|uniref:DUF4350 domain-containing protein n=1 Tax=Compostibacter hankyongensis TaxID=1007089 RepID=A0ABP8FFS1_9BACT
MKGYRNYIVVFVLLLLLYIAAQYYKPVPVDWRVTLSAKDKIPYGSFLVYDNLKTIFPDARVVLQRVPVYNVVNNSTDRHTAYLLIDPELSLTATDEKELLRYVAQGNYVFLAAFTGYGGLADSLHFKRNLAVLPKQDSVKINFTHPVLKRDSSYTFVRSRIDGYFSELDTSRTLVLGENHNGAANFVKIPFGQGAFFIHAAPICFSNYFFLFRQNNRYVTDALSCLPADIGKVYWDEYYKQGGTTGSQNPLRFFLTDPWLKWAFRVALMLLVVFLLFETKRRQRIIPVWEPPKNTSLDFVRTIGNVYFNHGDNRGIARKKIGYFDDFLRTAFYLSPALPAETLAPELARRSGLSEDGIRQLLGRIAQVRLAEQVSDAVLLDLNRRLTDFYKKVK